MGEDLKEHLDIAVSANLNIDLYNRYRQGAPEVKQETEKPAVKKTIQPEQEVKQEEKQQVREVYSSKPTKQQEVISEKQPSAKREEKPEITPPVMDLYDLFNFSREEETDRKETQTYRSLQTAQFVRPTAGDKYQSNHPYK